MRSTRLTLAVSVFVAALLGAVLASEARRQRAGALLALAIAALFDLLFLAVKELPATVPVAAALVVLELSNRIRLRALARSAPGFQETAPCARAVTSGRHPAGRT